MHRILLVEDDQADAYLTQRVFKDINRNLHQHIALEHSETGEAALTLLEAHQKDNAPLPDLILLDLNMPRMDGFTFLEHIKADPRLRLIPVVVLTTSSAQSDIRQSYAQGAAGYVVKSTSMDEFTHHMQRLAIYWFELVQRAAP
ncbi:response regulator [Halomonas sp. TBZ9]|uniref:Response regulator n=2 Tax=Vreelandella azerica TaxID=2732867 RepID=A0A7Y3TYC3_9GAMM|nr:response regulator [Halomonas azerica]